MHRNILVLLLLAVTTLLPAAPGDNTAAPPPLKADEAKLFAQSLVRIADDVAVRYVRPVACKDLLYAALAGLYEELRLPVPEKLQAELAKVAKDPPEQLNEARVLDADAVAYVAKVRESLGDVEPLRKGGDLRISVQALAKSLDPYSGVVSGEELRRGNGENINYGFGLEVAGDGGNPPVVKSVIPGGPAQRGGIRPGDQITAVDGKELDREMLDAVLRAAAANADAARPQEMKFSVKRGKTTRKVGLTSQFFKADVIFGVQRDKDEAWNYWLDEKEKIGYARIGSLENGVGEDLQQVLSSLKSDGMKAFVLDVRWSPGGFLNEAILVARLFLKDGTIASVKSRGQDDVPYKAQGDGRYADFPLVVLVNGETMGGSELIVAALQDNMRATIVGQRTFGKASVQTMLALPLPNSGFKLTSGSFVRPSGKALHRFPDSKPSDDWGVQPEEAHRLPVTPDLSKQLREWHVLHSLRPGSSDDILPLDDPDNDPQRQLGLRVAKGLVK